MRGTRGTRKRETGEGGVFHPGQRGQKYARDTKAWIGQRRSFLSGTARTKVREGRVGRESADRAKEFFIRDKSTRGT
ncbi:hypothetical protein KI387_001241, partial [Taxus chinensis]